MKAKKKKKKKMEKRSAERLAEVVKKWWRATRLLQATGSAARTTAYMRVVQDRHRAENRLFRLCEAFFGEETARKDEPSVDRLRGTNDSKHQCLGALTVRERLERALQDQPEAPELEKR